MRPSHFITIAIAAAVMPWQTPASAQTVSTYQCRDGSEFAVAIPERGKAAHLKLDGKDVMLRKRVTAVGARYAKGDITLRMMKTGITLERGKRMTTCTAR
jgi:membrane-bound inhibitor of C-type lysozyme